jgi:hypothetical protein
MEGHVARLGKGEINTKFWSLNFKGRAWACFNAPFQYLAEGL